MIVAGQSFYNPCMDGTVEATLFRVGMDNLHFHLGSVEKLATEQYEALVTQKFIL
jgi:hypothetical protein